MKTKLFYQNSIISKKGSSEQCFQFVAFFLLALLLHSCQKQETGEIPTVKRINTFVNLTENEKEALKNLGYSTDSVSEFNDYYIVENDILIKKALLQQTRDGKSDVKVSQYNGNWLVSNYSDHNLNILVTQSIWSNSVWYSGLHNAVAYWNSLPNSNIKLHLITSSYHTNERVDITVHSDNGQLSSNVAADAPLPYTDGKPGSFIRVNTDFKDPNTNDFYSSQATWNMIHEIGHCLGFQHTNWYYRNEWSLVNYYGANHVPNTPVYTSSDPNSVMNGGTALSSCYSGCFSSFDQTAVNYLYPINSSSQVVPYIMGSSSLYGPGQSTYSVSYRSAETNINYKWEIIGINGTTYYYQDYESLPVIELPMPGSGNYKVKCTISNGKFSTAIAEKNIVIY